MRNRCICTVFLLSVALTLNCTSMRTSGLAPSELEEISRAARAYSEAWLKNEPEAVMSAFVAEPVLSPSAMPFVEGQAAARAFWWPEDSPPTTVTTFEYQELEVSGSGNTGYVRGTYKFVFEYGGKTYTNLGKYLHILERMQAGGWRISYHFWNDLPGPEEQ